MCELMAENQCHSCNCTCRRLPKQNWKLQNTKSPKITNIIMCWASLQYHLKVNFGVDARMCCSSERSFRDFQAAEVPPFFISASTSKDTWLSLLLVCYFGLDMFSAIRARTCVFVVVCLLFEGGGVCEIVRVSTCAAKSWDWARYSTAIC